MTYRTFALAVAVALLVSCQADKAPTPTREASVATPTVDEPPAPEPEEETPPTPEEPTKAAPRTPEKPTQLTPPPEAQVEKSGLASLVLGPGTGERHPRGDDTVVVHYSVWDRAGFLLDSSLRRGEPRSFRVDEQLAGWAEGLQLMVEGEKRRLWIPEKLAYRGRAGKPQGMLVWEAELLEIRSPPAAPSDLVKPPAEAQRTASGLAYLSLSAGTEDTRPAKGSAVQVHYTGWTTNGLCFDTTRIEGEPAMFNINDVIEGWTEGLQLMTKGQSMRFWIPKNLAYKGKKGRPQGTLVFDVELLDVVNP